MSPGAWPSSFCQLDISFHLFGGYVPDWLVMGTLLLSPFRRSLGAGPWCTGLARPRSSRSSGHPLIPPKLIPRTKYFWARANTIKLGIRAITTAAKTTEMLPVPM